jgi:hypothetical protein
MAAAIESQCGKYIITDAASRQGSFSLIGAGSIYQGYGSSTTTSFTTAAGRPDSRNSCFDKDWAGLGHAAAAAAGAAAVSGGGGDPAKGAVGYASLGSRGLPVWLATVLQIGGLFLLGMLGYVIACCFLEVRPRHIHHIYIEQPLVRIFAMTIFMANLGCKLWGCFCWGWMLGYCEWK